MTKIAMVDVSNEVDMEVSSKLSFFRERYTSSHHYPIYFFM